MADPLIDAFRLLITSHRYAIEYMTSDAITQQIIVAAYYRYIQCTYCNVSTVFWWLSLTVIVLGILIVVIAWSKHWINTEPTKVLTYGFRCLYLSPLMYCYEISTHK